MSSRHQELYRNIEKDGKPVTEFIQFSHPAINKYKCMHDEDLKQWYEKLRKRCK